MDFKLPPIVFHGRNQLLLFAKNPLKKCVNFVLFLHSSYLEDKPALNSVTGITSVYKSNQASLLSLHNIFQKDKFILCLTCTDTISPEYVLRHLTPISFLS